METSCMPYRLTRWHKAYSRDGVVAALHTLTLAVVYVPNVVWEQLSQLLPSTWSSLSAEVGLDVVNSMAENGLLVPVERDDLATLTTLRQQLAENIHLELMYLLVTDACNLACRYCFEDAPVAPGFVPSMMDVRTAESAIAAFARLTMKHGRPNAKRIIHLYGGEPLLNIPAIIAAITKSEDLIRSGDMPTECSFVLITNGSKFTDDLARFFAKHRVSVGVSIDGPRSVHNLYRRGKIDDIDSYARARRTYDIARKHGLTTGISVTMTPEVVQHFDEIVEFIVNDLKVRDGVGFNLLHFNPAVRVGTAYYEAAADCLIRAFTRFREEGIYEERVMRKAKAFIGREPMFADCGVVGNQIVVAPDGSIGVCQDFVKPRTYFRGSVHDPGFDPVEDGLFNDWNRRSPFFMEECFDCEALGICGGGCPASVELEQGSKWKIDQSICPHSKRTLEWLVWETYAGLAS